MTGRGGNKRALHPPDGRDLRCACLLFSAIWERTDKPGRRFSQEYERLRLRWSRLIETIVSRNDGVTPFGALKDTDQILDLLELPSNRNLHYPKPRDLTAEEFSCWEWRRAIASDALNDLYVNLGSPLQHPTDSDADRELWEIWEDACSFLLTWSDAPSYNANPNIKVKRWRRSDTIVRYRQEVADFCGRWRIDAWWAVPAVIQHHFFRAEDASIWDATIPPLRMYALEPSAPLRLPITVRLPGRSKNQFEEDKSTALDLFETTVLGTSGGSIRVVRTSLSRDKRANLEMSIDSSSVLFEWDGRRNLLQGFENWSDLTARIPPGAFLVERCQQMLGRNLKSREKRDVRTQVAQQIQQHWLRLGKEGWAPLGDGNLNFIAGKLSRLLLSQNVTWSGLTPTKPKANGKNRYDDSRSVRRACKNFAQLANLTLKPKRPGRPPGTRNIIPN